MSHRLYKQMPLQTPSRPAWKPQTRAFAAEEPVPSGDRQSLLDRTSQAERFGYRFGHHVPSPPPGGPGTERAAKREVVESASRPSASQDVAELPARGPLPLALRTPAAKPLTAGAAGSNPGSRVAGQGSFPIQRGRKRGRSTSTKSKSPKGKRPKTSHTPAPSGGGVPVPSTAPSVLPTVPSVPSTAPSTSSTVPSAPVMSAEVPMLTDASVKAAQAHLAGGENQKALDVLTGELISSGRIDPALLEKRYESGGAMSWEGRQPPGATLASPGFVYAGAGAPDVHAEAPPPGWVDPLTKAKALPGEVDVFDFGLSKGIPVAVSKLLHENVHLEQYQQDRDPGTGKITGRVHGQDDTDPSLIGMQEVEAHHQEITESERTGVADYPQEMAEIESWLEHYWKDVTPKDRKRVRHLRKEAVADLKKNKKRYKNWKKAQTKPGYYPAPGSP